MLLVFTEKHVFVVSGCQYNLFYLELCTPWAQLKLMEMSLVLIESESKPNYESEISVWLWQQVGGDCTPRNIMANNMVRNIWPPLQR